MKTIIYPQNDGKLGVIYPVQNININDVVATTLPQDTPYLIVDKLDIDSDFFDSYEFTMNGPRLNIAKAHNIWKDKWRKKRQEKLQRLDTEFIRAVETNNTNKQQEIASRKQQLRDITNITLPNTLEQIKNIWPNELVD